MPPPDAELTLRGKAALVTGAGRGLGRATAIALARRGAHVLVADLDEAAAKETARMIGKRARSMKVDVSREDEVGEMVDRTERELGPLFAAVNNAAVAQALRSDMTAAEIRRLCFDDAELRRVWSVNVDGVRHGMKHQLRVMRPRGRGVILNVSSNTAFGPWMGLPLYTASKAAMLGLTRSLARRLAPEGVRVNALCPGGMATKLLRDASPSFDRLAEDVPVGRLATVEEIGETAAWMCDADARYMIGHALVIDGGVTSW